jgi:hypothetical protein
MLDLLGAVIDAVQEQQEALGHILGLLEGLEVRIKEALEIATAPSP